MLTTLLACAEEEPAPPPLPCTPSNEAMTSSDLELDLENACGALHLRNLFVEGDGDMRVELYTDGDSVLPAIVASDGDAVFRELRWSGWFELAGDHPVVHWKQGYQSWSSSGVFDPGEVERDEIGLPLFGGDGTDTVDEVPWTSWWGGLVGRADGGSLLLGVASATRTKFTVSFDGELVHARWGGRGEAIDVHPGTTLFLDRLTTRIGPDATDLWAAWSEDVATLAELAAPAGPPPVGWSSWTVTYDDIGEDDVLAELSAHTLPAGAVFQIDDGWQRAWGDWQANERFPSGTSGLAGSIAARGLVPGLWMAPLLVDRGAPTYADHPGWWVRDAAGVEHDVVGHAVLDITAEGAEEWLAATVTDRVAEGFGYFKLDYLFAGALEGRRAEPATGVEAYGRALDVLSAAAGDAVVLACGAPMLPTVGRADAWRSGADIAFALDPDPRPAYLRSQARQTAARAFTHRWWWVDPDAVVVREPLTDVEVTGALAAAAVAGGSWLLGDSFVDARPDRTAAALDAALLEGRTGGATPRAPLVRVSGFDAGPPVELVQEDDAVPWIWDLPDGRVVLLNLGLTPVTLEGPGGTEMLGGEVADAGPRELAVGAGEIWKVAAAP